MKKYPHTSLNLLISVYVVEFDVETALENSKLVILERLVLQIPFAPSQPHCGADHKNYLKKILVYYEPSSFF